MIRAFIPENLELGKHRNPDRIRYLISLLYSERIKDKRYSASSFIPLNSIMLKAALGGRYKDTIRQLISEGIIESDNRYKVGSKSIGYRIAPEYASKKFISTQITNKRIIDFTKQSHDNVAETEWKLIHNYLYNCLLQTSIDSRKAYEFIAAYCADNDTYNAYLSSINMIASGSYFLKVDSTAGRVHTNISNMAKVLRPFLKFRGRPLIEIDIANSQPFIFNALIDSFVSRTEIEKSSLHHTNNILKTETQQNLQFHIPHPNPYVPQNKTDNAIYKEITSNGVFYESLMKSVWKGTSRDEAKLLFFKLLFSRNHREYLKQEKDYFAHSFPTVYEAINYFKQDDHTFLAISLQRAESDIMINQVATQLAAKDVFLLTIHDSILTTIEFLPLVESIIKNTFQFNYGLTPTLKLKGV